MLRTTTALAGLMSIFGSRVNGATPGAGPLGVGPVVLGWEGPLVSPNYSHPLFNDFGHVIRGNFTNGEEFSLWLFMYRQIGSVEFVSNGDLFQLGFIHGNFTDAEKTVMHDTPFVNIGQDVEDNAPLGTIQYSSNSTTERYTFEGFTLTSSGAGTKPKTWTANGSRGGVTVNINNMSEHGDEYFHAGAFSDLSGCNPQTTATNTDCTGYFGGIVHENKVTGTISFNDTTLTIDTAYGVHERIMQAGSVPSRIVNCMGNGFTWLHSWGPKLDEFIFTVDTGGPLFEASYNVDGMMTQAATGVVNASIAETAHWIDPKTNSVQPTAWHGFINGPTGRLDAYVQAFGRLHYYWVRTGGLIQVTQFICNGTSTFTFPNGTVMTEQHVAFVEYARTSYIQTPNPNTPLPS